MVMTNRGSQYRRSVRRNVDNSFSLLKCQHLTQPPLRCAIDCAITLKTDFLSKVTVYKPTVHRFLIHRSLIRRHCTRRTRHHAVFISSLFADGRHLRKVSCYVILLCHIIKMFCCYLCVRVRYVTGYIIIKTEYVKGTIQARSEAAACK